MLRVNRTLILILVISFSGCSWIPFTQKQNKTVKEETVVKPQEAHSQKEGFFKKWIPFIGQKEEQSERKPVVESSEKDSRGALTRWIPFVGGDKNKDVQQIEDQSTVKEENSEGFFSKWVPFVKTEEEKRQAEMKEQKKKENFEPFIETKDPPKNVEYGAVADKKQLKKGGKLLVIPFRAWANIEANKELDQIALWMVKGISEQLTANGSNYEMLYANNANEAEYIMEGFITEKKSPSFWKALTLRKNIRTLSVKGKITNRKTGETIIAFNDTELSKDKKVSHRHLGYLIGRNIGRYVSLEAK